MRMQIPFHRVSGQLRKVRSEAPSYLNWCAETSKMRLLTRCCLLLTAPQAVLSYASGGARGTRLAAAEPPEHEADTSDKPFASSFTLMSGRMIELRYGQAFMYAPYFGG